MLTDVTVGVVGRAHGVHGELYVDARTDEPERRFAPGAVVHPQHSRHRQQRPDRHDLADGHDRDAGQHRSGDPAEPAELTIRGSRQHHQRWLITFAEINDRETAELFRGCRLVCRIPGDESPTGPEEYYDRQLVGLSVYPGYPGRRTAEQATGTETVAPQPAGTVRSVLHHAGQDVLEVDVGGDIRLVPFVSSLVTDVDLAAETLTVADVPGLLTDSDPD